MAIWQDLVDQQGFPGWYAGVRRFVGTLRGQRTRDAHPVIGTAPGEEGQGDYGDGPMVRHPVSFCAPSSRPRLSFFPEIGHYLAGLNSSSRGLGPLNLRLAPIGSVPRQNGTHNAREISVPVAPVRIVIGSVDNVECGGMPFEKVSAGGRGCP
jgi:hypothetical protein